jgi:hypothetical protein
VSQVIQEIVPGRSIVVCDSPVCADQYVETSGSVGTGGRSRDVWVSSTCAVLGGSSRVTLRSVCALSVCTSDGKASDVVVRSACEILVGLSREVTGASMAGLEPRDWVSSTVVMLLYTACLG